MGGIARVPVAIALGSNLGDRDAELDEAEDRLAVLLSGAVASARYETDSVGGPADAPAYLNEVVVGSTLLAPRPLLEALQAIEIAAGRERPFPNAPRTLDLALILYGDFVIDEPGLAVPHPRFRDRLFVLQPLAEVAGDWVDPVSGQSVQDLLEQLPST
ncbi:2-amino-4-hydroxy-6-hydroxymethyldihydropteridine diphosphokinase [Luteitalea sp.]